MSDPLEGLIRSQGADVRFVVTGPTGWIGSATLAWLAQRLGPEFTRRVSAYGSSRRVLTGTHEPIEATPLAEMPRHALAGAIVFHLAYLTKDKLGAGSEGDYARRNVEIDEAVLAACAAAPPRGVFVPSSGAASAVAGGRSKLLYGAMKLVQEDRFAQAAAAQGFCVFIGRIFNIAGPHVNKWELYALSSFLIQGLRSGRMAVAATTPVFRSYVHVEDLIGVVMAELLSGRSSPDAVDIAGAQVVEMSEVAAAAAAALGLDASAITRPSVDWDRPSVYVGDPCPFAARALRHGVSLRSFEAQVRDTANFLRALEP